MNIVNGNRVKGLTICNNSSSLVGSNQLRLQLLFVGLRTLKNSTNWLQRLLGYHSSIVSQCSSKEFSCKCFFLVIFSFPSIACKKEMLLNLELRLKCESLKNKKEKFETLKIFKNYRKNHEKDGMTESALKCSWCSTEGYWLWNIRSLQYWILYNKLYSRKLPLVRNIWFMFHKL